MTITEDILTAARCFSDRDWSQREEEILAALCQAAQEKWSARLREGLAPEDCRGAFVTACAWSALGAMQGGLAAGESFPVAAFSAGDLTVRRHWGSDAAARSLEAQAEALMEPYVQDGGFAFLEVTG